MKQFQWFNTAAFGLAKSLTFDSRTSDPLPIRQLLESQQFKGKQTQTMFSANSLFECAFKIKQKFKFQ